MNNKTLIFTATYNEAENIKDYLKKIDALDLSADVLIIDDNSPDKTWKIVQEYKTINKNLRLIIRNKKEGLDTAHKMAFEYSVKNNYKYLITMDADLTHDPKKISQMLFELKKTFLSQDYHTKHNKTNGLGPPLGWSWLALGRPWVALFHFAFDANQPTERTYKNA